MKSPDFFLGKLKLSLCFFIKKTLLFPYLSVFFRVCQRFSVFSFASFKIIHIFAIEIIPYEIAITSFS